MRALLLILASAVLGIRPGLIGAQPRIYEVVSPGSLQAGQPIPPPQESVVLTVHGRIGVTHNDAAVLFDLPTLEHIWDLSQVQRELLRLGILLERTRVPADLPALDDILLQLDLVWSQMDRLDHGASRRWIQPHPHRVEAVAKIRTFLETCDRLLLQARDEPTTAFTAALSGITEAHLLANWLSVQVHQDLMGHVTLLKEAFAGFRRHVVQYAVGLAVLIALLMYMTWRHMRSEQALQESEHRGRLTFCNDFLLRLTDRQRGEVLGQSWFDLFLPADQRDEVRQLFMQDMLPVFIQGGLPVHYEHDLITRQGERRAIAWNTIPLHNAHGNGIGATSIGVDLTERKRAAQALQKAHDELEQRIQERTADLAASNASLQHEIAERQRLEDELLKTRKLESVGLLAGGIAHDFNNILTAILGNISLAKQYAAPESTLLKRLGAAENACQRATDLPQQLLTFSKGGAPIKRPMSIAELIQESANFALRGSNVRCEFAIPDTLWAVDVDEGQMSQVISNIIINADQAMPYGGIIRVQAENATVQAEHPVPLRPGKNVRISITDHGVGIPQEHLSKIFDPYFTTKPHGSGLGLATAYAIVQKHDGYVAVETALGIGTTFFIYLPASSHAVRTTPVRSVRPQGGTGKIVIMDDEAVIRELLELMLSQLGYSVESASDGTEAIALYSKARDAGHPFDAVSMDLTIPGGMGGKNAIHKLREIDPQIRAMVSSGYSTDPIMANFQHYGFRGVVVKPYNMAELSTVLHRVMTDEEAVSH
jgi:PAS domain S-box-containing protein